MNFRSLLALSFALSVLTAGASAGPADVDEADAAFNEVLQRSGLPSAELKLFLADCDASQQSMLFCAWRDQVLAERGLSRTLTGQQLEWPACGRALDRAATSWRRARDHYCARSAAKSFGGGSMQQTEQTSCVGDLTARVSKRLSRAQTCSAATAVLRSARP